jgi:hypothetical protein
MSNMLFVLCCQARSQTHEHTGCSDFQCEYIYIYTYRFVHVHNALLYIYCVCILFTHKLQKRLCQNHRISNLITH